MRWLSSGAKMKFINRSSSEPLKNSWHTEMAIGILLNDEELLEDKLDLLTSISLDSTNEETFRICEKLRDNLVNSEKETVAMEPVSRQETVCEDKNEIGSDDDNGETCAS